MATHAWKNSQRFLAAIMMICGFGFAGFGLGQGISDAFAESTEGAQGGMSKAYNDYYRALRAQPSSTPSDAARLSKEILKPAQEKLSHAISESTQQTLKNIAPPKESYIKTAHWGSKARAKKKGEKALPLKGQPTPSKSTVAPVAKVPEPEPSVPREPETALDGSNVPREIEFPGPAKATPGPSKIK